MMIALQETDKRTFLVHGKEFTIFDPDDSVAAETMSGQIYEPSAVSLLLGLLRQDAKNVFLDVGALYGYFTCMVKIHHPECLVHAFEPSSSSFRILKCNLENLNNTFAHQMALSDKAQILPFKGRTFTRKQDNDFTEQVLTICYDDWSIEQNINNIIAKIDVHGAEFKVLYGMRNSLRTSIRHVIMEVHAPHLILGDYTYAGAINFLMDTGFEIFEIEDFRRTVEHKLVPLKGKALESFIDPGKWTEFQVKHERMIYAARVV